MFNVGITEMIFIALLALIFLGPERLPKVMREVGELVAQLRQIVGELNSQFSEELKPLREIQGLANDLNPMKQIGGVMSPVETDGKKLVSENSIAPPEKQQAPPLAAAPPPPNPVPNATVATANPMALISQTKRPGPKAAAVDDEQAAGDIGDSAPESQTD